MRLRAARRDDAVFLFELYASTREGEFALLDPETRLAIVRMQYAARRAGYAAAFPHAEQSIVECEAEPAGQVIVASSPEEIRVVDISVLPAYRRRGLGRSVYAQLIERAAVTATPVTATVAKSNEPSIAFHRALGFAVTGEDALSYSVALTGISSSSRTRPGATRGC